MGFIAMNWQEFRSGGWKEDEKQGDVPALRPSADSQLPKNNTKKKNKNASCEYDRWVVETQLRKVRDTSDTLIGRACEMFHL